MDVFYETISSVSKEEYWSKIESSGWLSQLKPKEILDLRNSVYGYFDENGERSAVQRSLSIHSVEYNYFGESYSELLIELSDASGKAFRPSNITEHYDEETGITNISFEYNGKLYAMSTLRSAVDDTNIFHLVNKALKEAGAKRSFCVLPMGEHQDDIVHHAFISADTYNKAMELGVIPHVDSDAFYEEFIDWDGL